MVVCKITSPPKMEGLLYRSIQKQFRSFFKRHLNKMAGTFFGTQAATFAKVEIKLISSGCGRFFNGIVRAVHKTVAAVETESATETALGFIDDLIPID